jgi:hypothetical protein
MMTTKFRATKETLVPNDPPEVPFISERQTVELCGDELRRGVRCVLASGHEGEHEGQAAHGGRVINWKSTTLRVAG